jgi:hypothetical protein
MQLLLWSGRLYLLAAHYLARTLMFASALYSFSFLEITICCLQDMRFDNTFVRELPGDKETTNSLRQVRLLTPACRKCIGSD